MCDFENYEEAVKLFLPQLTKLDGRELIPGLKTHQSVRKPQQPPPSTKTHPPQVTMHNENLNINNVHTNPFKSA
jgi:hypothetical protein